VWKSGKIKILTVFVRENGSVFLDFTGIKVVGTFLLTNQNVESVEKNV